MKSVIDMINRQTALPRIYAGAFWKDHGHGVSGFRIVDTRDNEELDGCTHGAFFTDWMKGDPALTCEAMFMDLAEQDFASDAEWNRFLTEFSRIEGFDWVEARFRKAAE